MNTGLFSDRIKEILSFSGRIHDNFPDIDLIINPVAGTFQKKNAFHSRIVEMRTCLSYVHSGEAARVSGDPKIHVTEYPGHAKEIMKSIFRSGRSRGSSGKRLVVTAGGDGTHLEALSALVEADDETRSRICMFRLPMGTGNDSADAVTLSEACTVLAGNFRLARTGAVRFSPTGMDPLYAFNIGGLGLDAFVVILKNALRHMPGNIYRAMVDVATLAYEPLYGVKDMHATLMEDGNVTGTLMGNFIMFVVGLSGERTYGDHIHILPGEENVCAVRTVGLRRKLALKKCFYAGTHREEPEVTLANADSIIVEYPGKLPLQLDGEAVVLTRENFPLKIDILKPVITVLHPETLTRMTEAVSR